MAFITHIGDYFSTAAGFYTASVTTHTSGPSVDRLGYDHLLAVLLTTGVVGTSPTFDVKVQHSTQTVVTSFADYTPDFIYPNNNQNVSTAGFPQVTTNGASKLDVDLQKANRYIQFVPRVGGTSPAATLSVVALLGQREGTIPGSTA